MNSSNHPSTHPRTLTFDHFSLHGYGQGSPREAELLRFIRKGSGNLVCNTSVGGVCLLDDEESPTSNGGGATVPPVVPNNRPVDVVPKTKR
eukprot:1193633-Prorocentrum_minimum.AAC.1